MTFGFREKCCEYNIHQKTAFSSICTGIRNVVASELERAKKDNGLHVIRWSKEKNIPEFKRWTGNYGKTFKLSRAHANLCRMMCCTAVCKDRVEQRQISGFWSKTSSPWYRGCNSQLLPKFVWQKLCWQPICSRVKKTCILFAIVKE